MTHREWVWTAVTAVVLYAAIAAALYRWSPETPTWRARLVHAAVAVAWPVLVPVVLAWATFDVLTGRDDDMADYDRPTPDSTFDSAEDGR